MRKQGREISAAHEEKWNCEDKQIEVKGLRTLLMKVSACTNIGSDGPRYLLGRNAAVQRTVMSVPTASYPMNNK